MTGSKKGGKHAQPVIKATVLETTSHENALNALTSIAGKPDSIAGVLDPPYPPGQLVRWYELSSVLPQHIDAIVTNVDSYGHKFIPAIDLTSANAQDRIKNAMIAEELDGADLESEAPVNEPSATLIKQKLAHLKRRAAIELTRANTFFASCCPEYSFIELRSRLRQEERVTGNAYLELIRDEKSRPSRMCLASSVSMRLLPRDTQPTSITEAVRTTDISWDLIKQQRYFRRYAEIDPRTKSIRAYFKEYGDPRVVSRQTGKIYTDMAAFLADKDRKPEEEVATEIIHFSIPSPGGPYGVPQWIGNLPAVMGSRELDEVNLGYFENKAVPPLALLVNGGRLAKGVVPRIEEFIEQQIKGKKNFHKILIIEAEGQKQTSGTSSIVPTISFEPLREAQQDDALFQNYDERNWDKVASSFRLPRILVGRDRAINRATAIAALRFAEEQVFQPIRSRFDEFFNRHILPELGIFFWRFRSNTPITRDPEMLAEIVATLTDAGVVTPEEGRRFSGDVFNEELPVIDKEWTREPMKLILARIKAGIPEEGGPPNAGSSNPTGTAGGGDSRAADRLSRKRSQREQQDAQSDDEPSKSGK